MRENPERLADQVIEQIKEMNYSERVIPVSGMAHFGTQEIIKRNKPQIACYASGEQLWKVPQFLKKIVPEYKVYYRHYGIGSQAMICYARV